MEQAREVEIFRVKGFVDESSSVTYSPAEDVVDWSASYVFDQNTWETSNYGGKTSGSEWLEGTASAFLEEAPPGLCGIGDSSTPIDVVRWLCITGREPDLSHLFLDSFSVIENGELSKRRDREIARSPATTALLSISSSDSFGLSNRLSPRQFEYLVASVLSEAGFRKVSLRRYVKDGGADIVAVLACGSHDETIIVEVKHGKSPVGLAVLDRLDGVRQRMGADRSLLVTSSHVTRDAVLAYSAHSAWMASKTFSELVAILKDSPDWKGSPGGLWSKT